MVAVQMDVVYLWYVDRLKCTGHKGHELAEDTDAAMPEGGLGEAAGQAPWASAGVVHLHHVRQLKCVVIATRHKEAASQNCHTTTHVHLGRKVLVECLCLIAVSQCSWTCRINLCEHLWGPHDFCINAFLSILDNHVTCGTVTIENTWQPGSPLQPPLQNFTSFLSWNAQTVEVWEIIIWKKENHNWPNHLKI